MYKSKKKYVNRWAELFKFIAALFENPESYKHMPYKQYLNTYHWKILRETKLTEVDFRCQVCYNNTKLHVHHRTYERLGREKLTDLTVLCEDCHTLFHKSGRLKK